MQLNVNVRRLCLYSLLLSFQVNTATATNTQSDVLAGLLAITGTVVHGYHLASQLGFPSANVELQEGCVLPSDGVYAGYAKIGSRIYQACICLGVAFRGVFTRKKLEAHILDFSGDLYGQVITVYFVKFLREKQKFNTVQELMAQIAHDVQTTRETVPAIML